MTVWFLSTVQAGLDVLTALDGRIPLAGVISLSPRAPGDAISGFVDMAPHAAQRGLAHVAIDGYGLDRAEDQARIKAIPMDLLLVMGWQRLVPPWLLAHLKVGAIGGHGSPAGISGGRGRSPQNWALLLGERRFTQSIFFIDAGIDSGRVIDTVSYPLDIEDDIASSYHKISVVTAEMLVRAWADGRLGRGEGQPQPPEAFHLPQRRPEDGAMDWTRSARQVCDFVRALSKPYPGAFTHAGRDRLTLWRASPFLPRDLVGETRPGQVIAAFHDGAFAVASGDGSVLVQHYDGPQPPVGTVLTSVDFGAQMRAIVERDQLRHPDHAIWPPLLEACRRTAPC